MINQTHDRIVYTVQNTQETVGGRNPVVYASFDRQDAENHLKDGHVILAQVVTVETRAAEALAKLDLVDRLILGVTKTTTYRDTENDPAELIRRSVEAGRRLLGSAFQE